MNKTFIEVFTDASNFLTAYKASGLYTDPNKISDNDATTLYYLLSAKYMNNEIINADEDQFKLKVFAIIFQYAPTAFKKLSIQSDIRELSLVELQSGAKVIYNNAMNPSTEPSTATLEELTAINAQNTSNYKKSKLEAYNILTEALKSDVIGTLVGRFSKLFSPFIYEEEV